MGKLHPFDVSNFSDVLLWYVFRVGLLDAAVKYCITFAGGVDFDFLFIVLFFGERHKLNTWIKKLS